MTDRPNERMAYFNGDIVPESRVLVPFRDRGFRWGDGVYDTERTINGKIFKLKEHIDRLYRSLRYLHITIKETPSEFVAITEEVVRESAAATQRRRLLGPSERLARCRLGRRRAEPPRGGHRDRPCPAPAAARARKFVP